MRHRLALLPLLMVMSCTVQPEGEETVMALGDPNAVLRFERIQVAVDFGIPTLTIDAYTVITADPERDLPEAAALIQVKKDLPMAMQRHDSTLFDHILAHDFLCADAPSVPPEEQEFLHRTEYINNRVSGQWTISHVRYDDIMVYPMGDHALMTYTNVVTEPLTNGDTITWHYSWDDVWVKENGDWKLKLLYFRQGTMDSTATQDK